MSSPGQAPDLVVDRATTSVSAGVEAPDPSAHPVPARGGSLRAAAPRALGARVGREMAPDLAEGHVQGDLEVARARVA